MMKITENQVKSLSECEPYERYKHSIKMIADTEEIFTICDKDGQWELAEVEGKTVFFIWSAKEYAQAFAINEWANVEIEKLTIEEFKEDIIPFIKQRDYLLSVFSLNNSTGFVVTTEEFFKDLDIELENYE